MHEIRAVDAVEAWKSGARHLLESSGKAFHILTTIERPTAIAVDRVAKFSPHTMFADSDRIRDVVATIFPDRLARRARTRAELYDLYMRLHQRAMRWQRNRARWGTYFERLVQFGQKQSNQLETAIEKLVTWPRRNTTGLVFHLSSPETDKPRTRGGPCWHFGEILWHPNDVLDLVVVYRNHDYFNKTLGNFVALGLLLEFIARQANKKLGTLVCHSIRAYSERPLKALKELSDR